MLPKHSAVSFVKAAVLSRSHSSTAQFAPPPAALLTVAEGLPFSCMNVAGEVPEPAATVAAP